jgi:carbamoyl-phosphate synthase small subunit
MGKKGYLILEDGTKFPGTSFGYQSSNLGEVVFNTSMTGYQEILTDPSYSGQIVTMTYPMIGNYGVNEEDVESDQVQVAGLIVKEYSKTYSNFRAKESLGAYLTRAKVSALEGIDTRKLTKYIRDKGAMRAGIFFEGIETEEALSKVKASPVMAGLDLATRVSCQAKYDFYIDINKPVVAVFDFGVKTNILRLLKEIGFSVRVYPGQTPLEEVLKDKVQAVFLSNGPGDPEAVSCGVKLVKDILKEQIPTFGICLGHQILSLGLGGQTYKLKFGHRGANQPVKNLSNGQVEITSQNHGFAVDYDSLKSKPEVEITHLNLNDQTIEGLRHKTLPLQSVQYHPEANPGPHDSLYLFKEFYDLVVKK